MATDEFEPFRGLPLSREQDAEVRAYIARCVERGEPWDTLRFSYMLKDMLALQGPRMTPLATRRATDGD
jgi:hypothetical protein